MRIHRVGERDQQREACEPADPGNDADDQAEHDAADNDGKARRIEDNRQRADGFVQQDHGLAPNTCGNDTPRAMDYNARLLYELSAFSETRPMLDKADKSKKSGQAIAGGPPLDFQDHLRQLEARGLVTRIDHADRQGHASCIRWCAGNSRAACAEEQRRAFLFTNVVDGAGRRYDIPVAVGALAASPEIYAVGMGEPVEDIGDGVDAGDRASDRAGRCRRPRACQEVVITGDDAAAAGRRAGAPAGADLDARFRFRALSHGDAVRHARPRDRRAEHGHLSRRA